MKSLYLRHFVLVFFSFLFLACSKEQSKAENPPVGVHTLTAKSADEPLAFSYLAQLVSEEDVILKPKVSGAVSEKLFKAGQKIKKDEPLFIIEQAKFKAANDTAKGQWLVARATFFNAQKEHKRNEVLIAKQAISQKEFDTSLANYTSASANLEAAAASFKSAQIDLNHSSVSAPFDGVVGDSLVNVGEYVSASSSQLVRITNLNEIYADFYMSDKDKLKLDSNFASGNWEIANIDANLSINGEVFKGKVAFVDSVVDENAKVKAKAVFENNEGRLLPSVFTTINMGGFVQKNGFKVPQVAILQDQKQVAYVYTIKEGKVAKTPVNITYQTNEYAIIDSGLENGDKIIVDNFKKIGIGAPVSDLGALNLANLNGANATNLAEKNLNSAQSLAKN